MVIPVVQVLYSLEIGGVEKLAVTIGAHLDRKRFRPAICALDRGGVLSEELARYGIPYHVLWRKGIEAGVLARLYRCFRQEKARVVHTHQFAQLLFSLLPAKACGARIVHTEHEYYTYLKDARARRMLRHLMRFCSALTVVGPEVARYYTDELGIPRSRTHVIANGVDVDRFASLAWTGVADSAGAYRTRTWSSVSWVASNPRRTTGPCCGRFKRSLLIVKRRDCSLLEMAASAQNSSPSVGLSISSGT